MLTLTVFVALGQTEIDNVDVVFCALITSDQEVVRLDISMDDPLLVHFLNSMDLQQTPTMATHSRGESLQSHTDTIENLSLRQTPRGIRIIALTI